MKSLTNAAYWVVSGIVGFLVAVAVGIAITGLAILTGFGIFLGLIRRR